MEHILTAAESLFLLFAFSNKDDDPAHEHDGDRGYGQPRTEAARNVN